MKNELKKTLAATIVALLVIGVVIGGCIIMAPKVNEYTKNAPQRAALKAIEEEKEAETRRIEAGLKVEKEVRDKEEKEAAESSRIHRAEINAKEKAQTVREIWSIVILIFCISIYFIPTIVAFKRTPEHNNFMSILVLNIFTGWTGAGWIACLVWACINAPRKA